MKINFKIVALGAVLASVMLLAGCENTVSGFGKDMQNTGQAIQKSTNDK